KFFLLRLKKQSLGAIIYTRVGLYKKHDELSFQPVTGAMPESAVRHYYEICPSYGRITGKRHTSISTGCAASFKKA
ncbi:MAG: hypothetical protein Q4F29_13905, partial [Lachnospiraceae bacterium]|nr:hypothetical protein [Lachnospiraceae bacterium]